MAIKIVTDSTSCAEKSFIEKNDIQIVPLKIRFSDEERVEGCPGDYEWFYDKLSETKEYPQTSLPAPDCFKSLFDRITEAGDEVICVTIGSALSGTVNSARLAAEGNDKVSVIDSGTACQGILLLIEEALRLIALGTPRAEIVAQVEAKRDDVTVAFVPETVEYLKRGGRISLLKAGLAAIMKIKPQLIFKRNKLVNSKKSIGMKIAIHDLVAAIPATAKKLYVMCIGKSAQFESLLEKIKSKFKDIVIGEISPVMGAHVGPGTIGFAAIT